MSKSFYVRLAVTNIKSNSKTYIPYIISSIGMVVMFYNMNFVSCAKDIGSDSTSLRMILKLGMLVVGFFSVIFLFYTNSFLIKRRKKEFGLFNILGMEKKHIAKVMFFETLIISCICIITGLAAGIVFSKLMILILCKIINYNISFGFEIPVMAVVTTVALFTVTYFAILAYNIFQVHLSKPVELLKSVNIGEKEPKTRWLSAIIGVIALGAGYYIALAVKSPLAALNMFFIAVILVIIGTNFLFTAGSTAILKILRRNKKYYYKANHFISISGMIYRMKRNAVGLANICILSTMVIVMVSTTVSLYIGFEDVMHTKYPKNIIINAAYVSDSQAEQIDKLINEQEDRFNIAEKNRLNYRFTYYMTYQDGEHFTEYDKSDYSDDSITVLTLMDVDEYNRIMDKSESLSSGEALVYEYRGKVKGDFLDLNGYKLTIKKHLDCLNFAGEMDRLVRNSYVIIVDNVDTIKEINKALEGNRDDKFKLSYFYGFDSDADRKLQIDLITAIDEKIKDIVENYNIDGEAVSREFFYIMYGGLLYLGIFLGLLFIMETVLIIYYKQISEGFEDKDRFEIMQNVGMSRLEVKKAIKSQILTVFFLPLVTAIIHLAFAFNVITKLLEALYLTNVPLFAVCTVITVIVFAVFYTTVYALTARTYYKIVS